MKSILQKIIKAIFNQVKQVIEGCHPDGEGTLMSFRTAQFHGVWKTYAKIVKRHFSTGSLKVWLRVTLATSVGWKLGVDSYSIIIYFVNFLFYIRQFFPCFFLFLPFPLAVDNVL